MKVGFIGLGQMGRAMAGRLLDRGHGLTVYNRSPTAAGPFLARGAQVAGAPRDALDAEVVVTMLADDAALEAVWVRPDLAARMPASAVHLNMSTASPVMARRMAALHAAAGRAYIAAPVFGRPHVAAAGELDIVAAGPAPGIERCRPLFDALGGRTFVVGAEGVACYANIINDHSVRQRAGICGYICELAVGDVRERPALAVTQGAFPFQGPADATPRVGHD